MRIGGYQKLTLIDYPGKLATTVFTVGCTFRCGFCHNPELVIPEQFLPDMPEMEKEFFDFLSRRKGKLDGVCITGGEPTMQVDIIPFIKKVKEMGFLVKLDSNGSLPDVLEKIIDAKLVDYIAMDIKNSPQRYAETACVGIDAEKVKRSVKMIMESGISYEFRTTVVPGLHKPEDFDEIAKWIDGADAYYLQEYREIKILDEKLKEKTKDQKIDLEEIGEKIKSHFKKFAIRKSY